MDHCTTPSLYKNDKMSIANCNITLIRLLTFLQVLQTTCPKFDKHVNIVELHCYNYFEITVRNPLQSTSYTLASYWFGDCVTGLYDVLEDSESIHAL